VTTRSDTRKAQNPHGAISPHQGGYEDVDGPKLRVRHFRRRDLAIEPFSSETTTLDEFRRRWRLLTDIDGTRWVPR